VRRQSVLAGLLLFVVVVAGTVLSAVLATVFLAVTVAYLLGPAASWLVDRGWSRRRASLATTAAAMLVGVAVVAPVVAVFVLRIEALVDLIRSLPPAIAIEAFGVQWTLTLADLGPPLASLARSLARSTLAAVPVLALKLSVFVLLTYALVRHEHEARSAVLGIVPDAYHDVASAFDERVRNTLLAIYVLQAATAVGTFLLALPVFVGFGYASPIALAAFAGLLQFLPIVGPALLLAGLALVHVSAGELAAAVGIVVVGGVVVAILPDVVVRPRLARVTADVPGSLYFVGFVGGLLSLGTVGIVAGPVAVGLVVEAADLLADEFDA